MAKTASNQLGICLRIMHVQRMPKVSIFMAVTTKIVPEKAQKWPKMARFWPKWRYNGRAMARETFFYQCLWVTKFCAKFGRSRIPRTARDPNSFIVLRCMWKEPAPLEEQCYFENARRWKNEAGRDKIQDALSSPHLTKTKLNFINIERCWKAAKGRRVALVGPSGPCITNDGCWSGQSRVAA